MIFVMLCVELSILKDQTDPYIVDEISPKFLAWHNAY